MLSTWSTTEHSPRGLSARPWARRGRQLCPQGAEPGEGEKRKLKENTRRCLSTGGRPREVWGCLSATKTPSPASLLWEGFQEEEYLILVLTQD